MPVEAPVTTASGRGIAFMFAPISKFSVATRKRLFAIVVHQTFTLHDER
jgi:hypothetical protein